jgi:hypothetical protein
MSARHHLITSATGEPLFDVVNARGLLLLLGVSNEEAGQVVAQRQAEPGTPAHWRGPLRIEPARRYADVADSTRRLTRESSAPAARTTTAGQHARGGL